MDGDRRRQAMAIDAAFRTGDMAALRAALGDPVAFPRVPMPWGLGLSEHVLEYAIYWSPLPFIEALIRLGAEVDCRDGGGFPALMAALSSDRPDRFALIGLLLDHGADIHAHGVNDWTPLHHAVWLKDLEAVRLLLARGADASIRTRIDDCTTPLEDARSLGFDAAAAAMHEAMIKAGSR